jgi:hypothetical protein
MNCRDFQDNLFAYGEGKLAQDIRETMTGHAEQCESCSRLLAGYKAMEYAIEKEKALETDPFVTTRIVQRLENNAAKGVLSANPVLRPALITLLLLAALMTGYLVGNQGTATGTQISAESNTIEVLKTDFYVNDFVDEDITLLTDNQN